MASWWTWRDLILGRADQTYRNSFLNEDKNLAKIIFLILAFWVLSYIFIDYMVLNTSPGFYLLLAERLAFAVFSLVSIFYMRRNKDRKKFDLTVLIWSMALVIVSISANQFHPGLNLDKFSIHYVLIVGIYLIIPNRVIYKIISAATITILDTFLLIEFALRTNNIIAIDVLIAIITFLSLNIIGIIVAARQERQRFHQFLIQKTLSSGREQLISLATTDSLTGILNRRGFFNLAEIEVDRFQRYHSTFSFAIIDLDQLKAINDQHGHPAGDMALQSLIDCIEQNKRSSDFLGRLAGDEFGFCMPGIHKSEAEKLMLRIREKLRQQTITSKDGKNIQVHFSAGITEVVTTDVHFDDIYRRADKALYKAKEQGRDRVKIA